MPRGILMLALGVMLGGCFIENGSVKYARWLDWREDSMKIFPSIDYVKSSVDMHGMTAPCCSHKGVVLGVEFLIFSPIVLIDAVVLAPLRIIYGALTYPFAKEPESVPEVVKNGGSE